MAKSRLEVVFLNPEIASIRARLPACRSAKDIQAMGAMNGKTTHLLPRVQYAFGNLGGSQTETVELATHIDGYGFSSAEFVIRLHAGTIVGAGAQLQFLLMADGYDPEDPATSFLVQLASATVDSSFSFPYFTILQASAFGRFLQVRMVASQPASPVVLVAQVSLEVILKGGDPDAYAEPPNVTRGYENM